MPTLPSARLPWTFDAEALRQEVANLADDDWVPHFNTGYYEGDWSGAALRSVGGQAGRLYPDPTAGADYADTPLLARCPSTRVALDQLRCPLLAVRYLRLGPSSRIREHRDFNLGYEDGEVRIHVPISTDPAVEFLLDGRRVDMGPGEAWYLNLNLPHAVVNVGASARVHLVIDCVVNDWLDAVLTEALAAASSALGTSDQMPRVNDSTQVPSVRAAFERYEAALVANDLDVLDELMWRDERLVRLGIDDRQDGFAEVSAFRRAQLRQTPARTLQDTAVVTFDDHTAVITTSFVPTDGSPSGRQSQTWVRLPEGWRIVAAHVSWPASALRQALDP